MIIILAVILIALSYIVAIYRLLNVIPLHGPRPQGKFKKQRAQQESKSASGSQGLRSVVVWGDFVDGKFICLRRIQIYKSTCGSAYGNTVWSSFRWCNFTFVLWIDMKWLVTSNLWEPNEQPTMRFLQICHQATRFFSYGTSHPNFFDFCSPCENQVAEKSPAGTNITQIVSHPRTPIIPKVPSYSWTLGGLLPSRLWGPQWKQDFGCEPWFVLGLVWVTCQSDSIAKLDFSPFPKVPPLKFMPCCGDSHNYFPEFCFLKSSLVFDQTNLNCV